jgi:hypothetical protein
MNEINFKKDWNFVIAYLSKYFFGGNGVIADASGGLLNTLYLFLKTVTYITIVENRLRKCFSE